MYCPTCTTTPLIIAQRQGVETDFCPHCRGVWMDRGELEKLLDRAAGSLPQHATPTDTDREDVMDVRRRTRRDRRRSSWLSETFD